jgi:hypothetical protein
MNKFLDVMAWIIGVPLVIIIIFAGLGFMAVEFNFWPPDCNVLPLEQARMVCEFSHLDSAPKGKPAELTFWVTIPNNTPTFDKVFLAIDGKSPIQMDKLNDTSFQTTIKATTGDNLKYQYFRNGKESVSDQKKYAVKSFEKNIYDYVSGWSDLKMPPLSKNFEPGVGMIDTWTINYNMELFEDTRKDLDATMARIKSMGGKEIGIYTLVEMFGDENDFTVQEVAPMPTFILSQLGNKYMRDAQITQDEMKKIETTAKKYGLKTLIYYNIEADYTKYYKISLNPFAARGAGGNTAEEHAGADFGRYAPKTKEWLDRYFSQLKDVLVGIGKKAEASGINALDISPRYKPPTVDPLNAYADTKWLDIISAVRQVYHGEIYADGNPTFRDAVDGIEYPAGINVQPNATVAQMRQGWATALNVTQAKFASYKKPVYLNVKVGSYKGATSGLPGMEFADYLEVEQRGYKRDWQAQADAYEAFFQEMAGRDFFAGFDTHYFAYDDLMGPTYTHVRYNDLGSNIRNKPAEAVWDKWILSAK